MKMSLRVNFGDGASLFAQLKSLRESSSGVHSAGVIKETEDCGGIVTKPIPSEVAKVLSVAGDRAAVDIAAAANAAIKIALLAVELLPGGPVASKVARGVKKFVPVAKIVVQKLPDMAPAMAQIAGKAQDKMPAVAAAVPRR